MNLRSISALEASLSREPEGISDFHIRGVTHGKTAEPPNKLNFT